MATRKKATPFSLGEIYDEVARRADTAGLEINVAETKRVLACLFDVLETRSAAEVSEFIAKGLKRAALRQR
jgi:hypothetical protein